MILVDPSVESNWYLVNKNRWGKSSYILTRLFIPMYIFMFVTLPAIVCNSSASKQVMSMPIVQFTAAFIDYAFCAVIGFIFWRKYPKIGDTLHIREELRLSTLVYLVIGVYLVTFAWVYRYMDELMVQNLGYIGLELLFSLVLYVS